MEKDCPLCKLAVGKNIKTKLYYQDKVVIIVNCLTCGMLVVILKRHTMKPNNFERGHMEMVSKEVFSDNIKFRKKQGHPEYDHLHWHILRR